MTAPTAPFTPPEADDPLPIHGDAFSADPHATYDRLRARGPIAPVEISPGVYGYLAVGYRAAVYLLRNTPARFAKDPGQWEALKKGEVPADSPAALMMHPRDNALWKDGPDHARLRKAITTSMARVDTHALVSSVNAIADHLIDVFSTEGKADLVAQYAEPLAMLTVIYLFGSPPELGEQIVYAVTRLFDAGADAAQANADLEKACLELTRLKRERPRHDVTSHLIEAGLTDSEMAQTILLVFGAAAPPTASHIGHGLRRVLTDESFAGSVHDGVRPVSDALEELLWENPPIPNYSPLYALGEQSFEGVHLAPGYPILVSFAGANGDPGLKVPPAARAGNRGHLGFSAGVHACPAPDLARVIAETALERALDRLPGLDLAVPDSELRNRPGTFLAGLTALPVMFHPDTRTAIGR
ncbi:cytochrome P450 [Streptomyces sp. TS71-3]|uniref:cytochrome P450 n=1 Tax=Streptomyces sp. TS71-3 TaxID=2733862 RepID=UPI001B29A5D4|nr:cytochrome P450 [Streptomyces sp. TS71-3]GHJ36870.1 cytochrome P450 [Streptomyces sp. TS71-3]